MRKTIILIILFISNLCLSQEHHKFIENDWLGNWKGTLKILYPSKVQEVPMILEISKTDTPDKYKWFTKYGEGASSLSKEYFMIVKDTEKGIWILDEGNSILIDMYFTDGSFYTLFEVQKTLLNSIYTLDEGKIKFEVLSSKTDNANISGKNDGDINEVKSYPVFVVQKSVLVRQ